MNKLNLDILDDIDMDTAFAFLLNIYAEYYANAERLRNMALEYVSTDMLKAYNENAAQTKAIKEKIMYLWRRKDDNVEIVGNIHDNPELLEVR